MKLHALLGYPVPENFVSWCQTLKNSSASFLCIPETYIISRSRNLKVIQKCVHLKCICVWLWCLDNWSRILSGKPFNTFSMARLKTLQFRLTLTPLFACISYLSFTIFFSRSVIGIVRVSSAVLGLWLGYFFYSCDPWFISLIDSSWSVKFSKMTNFNFRESWFGYIFFFWDLWPESPLPLLKFSSYGKGVQNRPKFTNIIFFNFHLYVLGGIRLSCLPLNCHYHQISFALKQVVPVS
jgi:hypothetical protein